MKKAFCVLLLILLCLPVAYTALADKIVMKDPETFSDVFTFVGKENLYEYDDGWQMVYSVEDMEKAMPAIQEYLTELMQYPEFIYQQSETSPTGWVHHLFTSAEEKRIGHFILEYSDWKTLSGCIEISYHPDNRFIFFTFSNDLASWEDVDDVAVSPTPQATSTPKPTHTPKSTVTPTPKPNGGSNSNGESFVTCNACNGLGQMTQTCSYCSGTAHRDCVNCNGGYRTCGGCSGATYITCRSCHGTGKKTNGRDCSLCVSGRRDCSQCTTGTKRCSSCNGRGSFDCSHCVGGTITKGCSYCGSDGRR